MGSSEPAHLSSSCSTSGSAATVNNEESKKTVTTETTAQRVPSLCAVRSRSRRSQCIHRRSVLCSTWVKNTEDSNCSQKALGNCVVSTVQPASYVALSDRNDATDAALATAIPPLRELRAGDTFQGRRQPGHQNAAPSGAAADQQPPQSSQPVPQVTPSRTARYQTAPFGTLSSQNETSSFSPSFAEPPRWHSRTGVACSLRKSRKVSTGTRN